MESFGNLLRRAREEKKITVEQAAEETTITKNYIEALEEERVEAFPGEPYFIGFLNNYCEYLKISAEDVMNLYRAKKIQESPVPVELTSKHKPKFLIPLIIILSSALIIGLVLYLYFFVFNIPQKIAESKKEVVEKVKIHQYTFEGKSETKRLYKGDQILFPASTGNGNIVLTISNTLGNLTVLVPSGSQIIELSEERELDVDGDGNADVILYLADISDIDESSGAEVRIIEKIPDAEIPEEKKQQEDSIDSFFSTTIKNGGNRTVVHESTRAYPFTATVTVRTSCLIRYKVDRQDNIEEYYKNGDTISVTANNGIRLWTSNINAMKIQIKAGLQNYDLEVGNPGEVKAQDIKWVRDADGKYKLVVLELE